MSAANQKTKTEILETVISLFANNVISQLKNG